jgi:hypothetical protein
MHLQYTVHPNRRVTRVDRADESYTHHARGAFELMSTKLNSSYLSVYSSYTLAASRPSRYP